MDALTFLGGDAGVRALVDRFYRAMDERPDAAAIRAMHPNDLRGSADKLADFLIERFGGPPVYTSVRGHPRLRQRHFPFPIGDVEAAAWVACMDEALAARVAPGPERDELAAFFRAVAAHMMNR